MLQGAINCRHIISLYHKKENKSQLNKNIALLKILFIEKCADKKYNLQPFFRKLEGKLTRLNFFLVKSKLKPINCSGSQMFYKTASLSK